VALKQLRDERVRSVAESAAWLAKQAEIALGQVDLSLPQYRLLGLLAEGSAISKALADRLDVRPPSVTALVDGMVARGLIERRHAVDDRRQVSHVLTKEGTRVLGRADDVVHTRLTMIAGSLPDEEAQLLESLSRWGVALSAYHAARIAAKAAAK